MRFNLIKTSYLYRNLSVFILIGIVTVATAAPLEISDVPLELTPAVPPNVLILADDSLSMDWEVLTQSNINSGTFISSHLDGTPDIANPIVQRVDDGDGAADGNAGNTCNGLIDPAIVGTGEYVNGYLYIVAFPSDQFFPTDPVLRNCYVADDDAWRARSHTFNKLYFDPNKTYIPWAGVDINGIPYSQADITNAPDDPYNPQNYINLTSEKAGLSVTGGQINDGIGFKYFIWTDVNGDGIAQASEMPITINTDVFLIKDQDLATQQNFANWFTYYRKREFVAKAIISHSVANNSAADIDYTTVNQDPTASFRVTPLNQSKFRANQTAVHNAIGNTNSVGTSSLKRAYEKVGEYFSCKSNDIFNSSTSSNPGDAACPISAAPAGSCQVNSAFILTDGFDNGFINPIVVTSNEDNSGNNDTNFDGGAFADSLSNTLADIAMFYYENDLHDPGLDDNAPVTGVDLTHYPTTTPALLAGDKLHQHLNTNVVGIFNEPVGFNTSLAMLPVTENLSRWDSPATPFIGTLNDLLHASYNGRGDFFPAIGSKDFPDVINDVDNAFSTATTTPGSTTALAFNTQSITQDTKAFRTFSNLATNSGDLVAQEVNPDGTLKEDPITNKPIFLWSAADKLSTQTSRLIFTYDDLSSPPAGNVFLSGPANGLTTTQESALEDPSDLPANVSASVIVDRRVGYLRGDSTNEGSSFDDGEMRIRAAVVQNSDGINTGGKIGDIVHSSPVFVGEPPFANRFGGAFPNSINNTYFEFKTDNANRDELVYVGANDGMLHAFYVNDASPATAGEEKFAYIPNILLKDIPEFTKPDYSHQFFVDSTPSVNDVYIDPRPVAGSTREWRTVLVNGLGAGGKGYFALDITDPSSIATNSVMWEFTDSDDDDLGFTYSKPIIAMSNIQSSGEQRWVAIFGNGFNSSSSDGNAAIYILFLDAGYNGWTAGSDFIKIETSNGITAAPAGTPNGIAGVTGIDTNGNGTVDRLYAGDLKGNVYVFDISGTTTSSWGIEKTLFKANYTSTVPETIQAITNKPTVLANPAVTDTYTVIVGTGSYFTNADATSTGIQSIYGLWDRPGNNTIIAHDNLSSELVEQTLTTSIDSNTSSEVRTISANAVAYNDNTSDSITDVRGWHIDFDVPPPSGSGIQFPGERPVRNLQLRSNQLFFNTVIPQDGTSCEPPAGGFGLSVNPLTGGSGSQVIFDINIDGVFDDKDNLNLLSGQANIIVGRRFESAPSDSIFIGDNRVTQLSDTSIDHILVNPDLNGGGGLGALLGRHSWKEIRM